MLLFSRPSVIDLSVDAYTSGPSDSFPGTLNQFTGASPRTTGIWYDDTYDRSFFDAGSNCKGPPGAEGMAMKLCIAAAHRC